MKSIFLIILTITTFSFSQDTLLMVSRKTYKNDTLYSHLQNQYNKHFSPVYSITVNFERNDTTEIFRKYNDENKLLMYVQNGPYFRDRFDTTFYAYENGLTIIRQPRQNHENIRKEDSLGRHVFSSKKSYKNGKLILHRIDSVFYDDENHIRTSRSYEKRDTPPLVSNSHVEEIIEVDGEWVKVKVPRSDVSFPVKVAARDAYNYEPSDTIKKTFELKTEVVVKKNEQGQALSLRTQYSSGEYKTGEYKYDSLGRQIYTAVEDSWRDKQTFIKYTYKIKGDTLIRRQWKLNAADDRNPKLQSLSKESIHKVNGNPTWQYSFVDDEMVGEFFSKYNESGLVISSEWRRKVEGEWEKTRTIYEYERFEK